MNNGAFGENFPYSNFHDLNMDWIIKIAKDFLDQYTHIQEIIANGEQSLQDLTTSGLEQLQEKADALEALLQQWYDTHSADIANQLADALEDLNEWYNTHQGYLDQYLTDSIAAFNTAADNKALQTIGSIPDDYSVLAQTAVKNHEQLGLSNTASTVLPDCNTAIPNTLYHILIDINSISSRPANFPSDLLPLLYDFYVMTLKSAYKTNPSTWATYLDQYIIDTNRGCIVAKRSCVNNTWNTWIAVGESISFNSRLAFTTDAVNVINNLDNMIDFMIYHINVASASQFPANMPSDAPLVSLAVSTKYNFSPGNYILEQKRQYIIDANTLRPTHYRVYTKTTSGSWPADQEWLKIPSSIKTTIVDINGSGQYTSLTEAVQNATNGDIIFVKKGLYNNEAVKAWGKNITIIGEDKYQTIIQNTYNNYTNPPIEMSIGHIENITFYQKNEGATPGQYGAGYALHVEDNSLTNNVLYAKDVIFKSDLAPGVGIGLRPGGKVIFENCVFWSNENAGIFYHDCATGNVGRQDIEFYSCMFRTQTGPCSMRVHTQKWKGSTIYNTFVGCCFDNENGTTPIIQAEEASQYTGTATGPHGDFYNLINFFKGHLNYGNNVTALNYQY